MKIKSTVWHWMAAGSLCAGLLCGMGLEGNAQVGAPITDGQFVTAMRLGFAAQEQEEKAGHRAHRQPENTVKAGKRKVG